MDDRTGFPDHGMAAAPDPPHPTPALRDRLAAEHAAAFGWAVHCCDGDADDAADVLQATYMKVLSGRARYAGRSRFRTWLFGVVRLTAFEWRRAHRRAQSLAQQAHQAEPAETLTARSADAALLERERERTVSDALAAAIAQLPARQREILHLVFYQECSVAEAADVMGVSVGSARVHYDRAKQRLRALLASGPELREHLA